MICSPAACILYYTTTQFLALGTREISWKVAKNTHLVISANYRLWTFGFQCDLVVYNISFYCLNAVVVFCLYTKKKIWFTAMEYWFYKKGMSLTSNFENLAKFQVDAFCLQYVYSKFYFIVIYLYDLCHVVLVDFHEFCKQNKIPKI